MKPTAATVGSIAIERLPVTKILLVFLFLVHACVQSVNAQISAVQSGNWNDPATWNSGVPTAADEVIIANNYTVLVNAGAACSALQLGQGDDLSNGFVELDGVGALQVAGGITMGDVAGATGVITMSSDASLTCSHIAEADPGISGMYYLNAGTVNFTGTNALPDNAYQFNNLVIAGGTTSVNTTSIQIEGNLTIKNGATLDLGSGAANRNTTGGVLTIENGALLIIGGVGTLPYNFNTHAVGASSTVMYNGTSQTVSVLNSAQAYGNLIIAGSGTKQLNGSTGVAGNLSVNNGIFNLNGFTVNRTSSGGSLTLQAATTLRISGSGTLPANYASHVFDPTSTVEYRGTAAQQVAPLSAGAKYGNLSVTNSFKTLAGNVTVAGTLTFGGTPNKLLLNNNTLVLEGPITGSLATSRNFSGTASSNLVLGGSQHRTVFFDASIPGTTNLINQLTIQHNGFTTSLGNDLIVAGIATFTSGKLAIAGKTLTLRGSVLYTAANALQGSTSSNLVVNTASPVTISLDQTTDGSTNALNAFTVNCAGTTATLGSAVRVNGNMTVQAGTLDLAAYEANRATAGGTFTLGTNAVLKIGGTNSFPANYATHTLDASATIEYAGSDQSVVALNATNYPNLAISGSAVKSLASSITVNGNCTLAGGVLAIGNNVLTLSGSITNVVSGGIRGGSGSSIVYNSTAGDAGLSFDQSTPGSSNLLHSITFDCASRVVSLLNELNVAATVHPIAGTLASDGNLVLLSAAAQTASVGTGPDAGGYITGDVTVQRFISSGRKWHLLGVATGGAQSVNEAWQEGTAPGSAIGNGYGTWITNNIPSAESFGFDYTTTTSSMRTYEQSTNGWSSLPNTALAIGTYEGYMVFVRGDRRCTSTNNDVSNTILRTKGPLNQGTLPDFNVSAGKFACISNSYASEIDFRQLTKSAGINDAFYVWDPRLTGSQGFGAYQTFTKDVTGNYKVTPGGGSYGSSGSINNTIQSGQAFLVKSGGAAGTVQFTEAAKSSGNRLVSRPLGNSGGRLVMNLLAGSTEASGIIDGVAVEFDESYNEAVDNGDAAKLKYVGESISIIKNQELIAEEHQASLQNTDTIQLLLEQLQPQQYQLQITADNLTQYGLTPYLEDAYTAGSRMLSVTEDNVVAFDVTADSGSRAGNRFRIIFKNMVVLAADLIRVRAAVKATSIELAWRADQETNIRQYEIERSANGTTFFATGITRKPTGSLKDYTWLDEKPLVGVNYYRVKCRYQDGTARYSAVVKASIAGTDQGFVVYPNPIRNGLVHLQMKTVQKGWYSFQLINHGGQTMLSNKMHVADAVRSASLVLPAGIPAGTYQLLVTDEKARTQVMNVVVQ